MSESAADNSQKPMQSTTTAQSQVTLPRITIKFCTQCKWNLRAAYYAQELLQTFSTTIGEIALIPTAGGIFEVRLFTASVSTSKARPTIPEATLEGSTSGIEGSEMEEAGKLEVQETLIWDRKAEGGFPETKELKGRVRNAIDPKRDMGHIDRSLKKGKGGDEKTADDPRKAGVKGNEPSKTKTGKDDCKDCP